MLRRFRGETRWSLLATIFVLGLVTALTILPGQFKSEAGSKKGLFPRTVSNDPALPYFDIRENQTKATADTLAEFRQRLGKTGAMVDDIRGGFERGESDLRSRIPTLKVEYNGDIRIPEVIGPDVLRGRAFLTGPSGRAGDKRAGILLNFLKENTNLIGATDDQINGLKVAADYTNPDGNLSFVELNQEINGIPVFRGEVKAGFTRNGEMIRVINNFAPGLDYSSLSTEFGDPVRALKIAAGNINYQLKDTDTVPNAAASTDQKIRFGAGGDFDHTAERMYFPTEPGVAVAAWRILIWEPVNAYYVIVDADTGTVLWRKNITNDQTQSATYNVYSATTNLGKALDSPSPYSPGPTDPTGSPQATAVGRTNVTLIGNEGALSFNNLGWITDGTNGTDGWTDGNAVQAGLDIDGTNGVDAPQNGTGRVFNFSYTPSFVTGGAPPPTGTEGGDPLTGAAYRSGIVTNLFYLNNRYHDVLYQVGFTEAARNFQNDNFGRGGVAADRVSAEAQDSSGTNNANFATPADGGRGRMQMYVFTNGTAPARDGSLDSNVVWHEHTHGTSNRLIGNGSGLGTTQAGGMGEGWSDLYAFLLGSKTTDPVNALYSTGGYVTYKCCGATTFTGNYYYGIRRFPYAPKSFTGGPGNKPHNPLTFADIDSAQLNASDGAFPCSTLIGCSGSATEVHNEGEIWAVTGVEVWARFVTRLGHDPGTLKTLQIYTDGMKLSPLSPTFLQERDSVLAAAQASAVAPDAGADVADVWYGFAQRGMGFTAANPSGNTVVESFDLPNAVLGSPFTVSDSTGNNNGVPEPGEHVLLNVPVTNNTGNTVNNVTVTVDGGAPVNYGSIANAATVSQAIPYTISAAAPCGSSVSVSIVVSSALGSQNPALRTFVLGSANGVVQNFDGVTAPALPAGWTTTQDSGTTITWTTTTTGPNSAPNSAFANDPSTVNMSSLVSPAVPISSAAAQLKFRNKYITESTFDGMVLEISNPAVNSGAFQDIITAGGSFVSGGYNATISSNFSSPIAGRQAWSGTSAGGYIDTVVNLPASANGNSVTFRWRMASDSSVSSTGVNVDDVQIVSSFTCAPVTSAKAPFDFDGDNKTDLSIFRPSVGQWWYQRSSDNVVPAFTFGNNTDKIVPADFTGDGKADVAFFRPSTGFWYVLRSEDSTFYGFPFGTTGDVPAPADYDGDGKADAAVFRPSDSTWYISKSSGGTTITPFGTAGDVPVAADYDGDGKADVAIYRPSLGQWWIQRSTAGLTAFAFGSSTDKTVVGDYTGDGKADVALFRPSTGQWFVLRSEDNSFFGFTFGTVGDVPAPGDYDGDGKTDAGIFRPSSSTWYVNKSTGGTLIQAFGTAGDVAVPNAYVR